LRETSFFPLFFWNGAGWELLGILILSFYLFILCWKLESETETTGKAGAKKQRAQASTF